jgi:carbon-monoxide dehydrogenase small subunit
MRRDSCVTGYFQSSPTRADAAAGAGIHFSNSRAPGELQFRMSSGRQNSTVLDINLAFTLHGTLAQFSRPAVVNDFASFIIEEFCEKLSRRLQSSGKNGAADGRPRRWQAIRLWRRLLRKSPG